MTFKKECKHSVVYETLSEKGPEVAVRSVYVDKVWFMTQKLSGNTWPREIELEVRLPS